MNRIICLFLLMTAFFGLACGLSNQAVTTAIEKPNAPSIVQSDLETALQTDNDLPPFSVWQEPQAGAFSAQVPGGWLVNGGVSQSTGFYHPWLEMAEPDGRAAIVYGSRDMQIFILPHPEGSTIQENGNTFLVNSYLTGEQVAEETLRYWVQPICRNLIIDNTRNLNTSVSEGIETSEGSADFHCLAEGNPMVGKYIAVTHRIVDPTTGAGMWFSGNATGFVALQSYGVQAEKAFFTLRESLAFNPQWQAELTPIAGASGLYYTNSGQGNGSNFSVFEDQQADFCIRNGC